MAGSEARFGLTKFGGKALIYTWPNEPDKTYIFSVKKPGANISHWKCVGCQSLKSRDGSLPTVPTVRVRGTVIEDDPTTPLNPHFCEPFQTAAVEAYQLHRDGLQECKTSGKRPRVCYNDTLAKVARTYADDPDKRQAVMAQSPTFEQARSSLYRAHSHKYPIIRALRDIPDWLKWTYEGSWVTNPTDPKYQEPMLSYLQQDPPSSCLPPQKKGLQSVYTRSVPAGYNLPQFLPVRAWVRRLMALPLLPPQYVRSTWARILQYPPYTGDLHVDLPSCCLDKFKEYFEQQWLTDELITLSNHFDNSGPRTTNHAEGYNNKMRHHFQVVRPRLSVFLVKFQLLHHANHSRIFQLEHGHRPNERTIAAVTNDTQIELSKQRLSAELQGLNYADPHFNFAADAAILRHLDACQHYLSFK